MKVEAYIVKEMSAPFILGNDFTDQYSISLLREDGQRTLLFGKSGRTKKVHNMITSNFLNEDGHTFKVHIWPDFASRVLRAKSHRKSQKVRQHFIQISTEDFVCAVCSVQITPESTRLVQVHGNFSDNSDDLFVEKRLEMKGGLEAFTAALIH